MCGLDLYGPVADIFTRYFDIMQIVCGLHGHYVLDPEYMSKLWADIRTFKTKASDVSGNLQTSGMGTDKWHLLDHVCD